MSNLFTVANNKKNVIDAMTSQASEPERTGAPPATLRKYER